MLKDASFRVAPMINSDARQMIREIRSYPMLKGVRGQPPSDEDAITGILQATSRMLLENLKIQRMDLNSLMAYGTGHGRRRQNCPKQSLTSIQLIIYARLGLSHIPQKAV
jgi:hypothetical protein